MNQESQPSDVLLQSNSQTQPAVFVPQVETVNGKFVFVWTGSMTGSQLKVAVLEDFARTNPGARITVIFNSTGGGVDDCRESYNRMLLLRTIFSMHFTFIVVKAQSCALWFIQCADVRVGLPHSALMYHGVRWTLEGAKSQRELEEARKAMNVNQREFTKILCSRASDPAKSLTDVLARIEDGFDHNFTAAEAVELGWLDRVYTPKFAPVEGEIDIDISGMNVQVQS